MSQIAQNQIIGYWGYFIFIVVTCRSLVVSEINSEQQEMRVEKLQRIMCWFLVSGVPEKVQRNRVNER